MQARLRRKAAKADHRVYDGAGDTGARPGPARHVEYARVRDGGKALLEWRCISLPLVGNIVMSCTVERMSLTTTTRRSMRPHTTITLGRWRT
jgi:hypothetical protein